MIETKFKSDIKILKLSYKKNIDVTKSKHDFYSRVYIPASSNDYQTILCNIKYYLHITKLIQKAF